MWFENWFYKNDTAIAANMIRQQEKTDLTNTPVNITNLNTVSDYHSNHNDVLNQSLTKVPTKETTDTELDEENIFKATELSQI